MQAPNAIVPTSKDLAIHLHVLNNNLRAERMVHQCVIDTCEARVTTSKAALDAARKACKVATTEEATAALKQAEDALKNAKEAVVALAPVRKALTEVYLKVLKLDMENPLHKKILAMVCAMVTMVDKKTKVQVVWTVESILTYLAEDDIVNAMTHFYGNTARDAFIAQRDAWSTQPITHFRADDTSYICFNAKTVPPVPALPTSHPLYNRPCIIVACSRNDDGLWSVDKTYPQEMGECSSTKTHPLLVHHLAATDPGCGSMFTRPNPNAVALQMLYMATKMHAKRRATLQTTAKGKELSVHIQYELDMRGANKQTRKPAEPISIELFEHVFHADGSFVSCETLPDDVRKLITCAVSLMTSGICGSDLLLATASAQLPSVIVGLNMHRLALHLIMEAMMNCEGLTEEIQSQLKRVLVSNEPCTALITIFNQLYREDGILVKPLTLSKAVRGILKRATVLLVVECREEDLLEQTHVFLQRMKMEETVTKLVKDSAEREALAKPPSLEDE